MSATHAEALQHGCFINRADVATCITSTLTSRYTCFLWRPLIGSLRVESGQLPSLVLQSSP